MIGFPMRRRNLNLEKNTEQKPCESIWRNFHLQVQVEYIENPGGAEALFSSSDKTFGGGGGQN